VGERRRLRVFDKAVLRRIFGPKKEKDPGSLRKFHMKNFIICILQQMS
jgi:hypothetical protein